MYEEKKNEMKEKYAYAINALSVANGVDVGVAFDMLKANARGADYKYVKEEELKADYEELVRLAEGKEE